MSRIAQAIILILSGFVSEAAFPHHSKAIYDQEATVSFSGIVTSIHWANPHAYIGMSGLDRFGNEQNWNIELLNPASMRRAGWTRDMLSVGDELDVVGSPAVSPSNTNVYPYVIYKGQERIFDDRGFYESEYFAIGPTQAIATSLEGIWKPTYSSEAQSYLTTTELHNLTTRGIQEREDYDDSTMNFAIECEELPPPASMILPSNTKRILFRTDVVIIESDYDGGRRSIRLTDNPASQDESIHGFSIGRWEGNILVVESSQFEPNGWGNGRKIRSTEQKRLVEKFVLGDDGTSLNYEFELYDEAILAQPIKMTTTWIYRPDIEFVPDTCDLESAQRFLEN